MIQPDLFDAVSSRDEAIKTVLENAGHDWKDKALHIIAAMPKGMLATGEDLRLSIADKIGNPHHHNAYGALIMNAVRKGYLMQTGKYVRMRTPKSHARATPLYRVI
jgi:hypothetical protein